LTVLAPESTELPPNGAQCVNSYWDGFKCVDRYGRPVSAEVQPQTPTFVNDIVKPAGAVIEKCEAIVRPDVTITRIGSNYVNNNVQQRPMFQQQQSWNWNGQQPAQQRSMILKNVPLPGPVAEVSCCQDPEQEEPCVCQANGI